MKKSYWTTLLLSLALLAISLQIAHTPKEDDPNRQTEDVQPAPSDSTLCTDLP